MNGTSKPSVKKLGWRRREWQASVGLGPSRIAELIADGTIDSVKVGGARIITVSPEDFLNRFRQPAA